MTNNQCKFLNCVPNYSILDIALGKKAEQSSNEEEYGANRAIDGDMSSSLKDGSCILTETQRDPWWRVDLLKEYLVTDVSIVGESGIIVCVSGTVDHISPEQGKHKYATIS